MCRIQIRVVLLAMIYSGLSLIEGKAQGLSKEQKWTSSDAFADLLGEEVKIEGYSLRPPRGFESKTKHGPEGSGVKQFAWIGPARDDQSRPSFLLMTVEAPPGEIGKYNLDGLAEKMIGGVKRRRTAFEQSRPEKGLINGQPFARIRWAGVDANSKRPMQGFIFVTIDGNKVVQMSSQDDLPHVKEALPLAEGSAMTFKKP